MRQVQAVFVDSWAWNALRCHEIRSIRKRESNGTCCRAQGAKLLQSRDYWCYIEFKRCDVPYHEAA